MNVRRFIHRSIAIAGLVVTAIAAQGLQEKEPPKKVKTEELGGKDRYLTHVSTDKPIYRAGEKVYVRGVILNAQDHKPVSKDKNPQAKIEIRGPKGDVVASGMSASADSVLGFHWPIPDGQPGGEYTIKVDYPWSGLPPAERKFDIRAYRAPRLKSQIVFLRKGYGPGDEASASLHVERAEGGIPTGARVTATARVDGKEVYRGQTVLDVNGNCSVTFKLPQNIERGEGTLALGIEDGGVLETAAQTIPILLQTVDLTMYPEGGDLVAGLPNRVYIEAKTPSQKPADLAGIVVDHDGEEVTEFRTVHEGRGWFEFTPAKGGKYQLRILEPAGIRTTYELPKIREEGVLLSTVDEVTDRGLPVRLKITSTATQKLKVTLSQRETDVSSAKVDVRAGVTSRIYLTPPDSADGVLIATVWDEAGFPRAERLIYRRPAKSLRIELSHDQDRYIPGGRANIKIRTTDEDGKPVSAVVGLSVTDDSVLEMIEKREQSPRLPVMVLLEGEVKELADAHVYLDEANPDAPMSLDLILGTQGWRRFAFVKAAEFIAEHGDPARRVLAHCTLREELCRPVAAVWEKGLVRNELAFAQEPRDGGVKGGEAPDDGADGDGDGDGDDNLQKDLKPGKGLVAGDPVIVAEREQVDQKKDALELAANKGEAKLRARQLLKEEDVAFDRVAAVRNDFVAVRVYAHEVRPNRQPSQRTDFTETLHWSAGIRTDEKTGEATVSFALNDSVTAFRVFADAFSKEGSLGQAANIIESVEPFYIEPKLPLVVTAGDVIQLPVSLVNGTSGDLSQTRLTLTTADGIGIVQPDLIALNAGRRERRIVKVEVGNTLGLHDFTVIADAGNYQDRVTRQLRVAPSGFPTEVTSGGTLDASTSVTQSVSIPASVVRGSVTTSIAVYPTPLANLTSALERLIREPYGCFEQTSSTTYPLVMAQQYFMSHQGVDPALIERSQGLLEKGYNRLVSFECKQKGYEWFGGDPGHEALTAYGLLEFSDMRQVREVDASMIQRTRNWLLERRDGQGGFQRNSRALDSFGRAPEPTTNAYCIWALLEAGERGLEKEIDLIRKNADTTKDSYVIALAANVLHLSGDSGGAEKLMKRMADLQVKDGHVSGAVTSITRSGGQALTIEATSLAILAWLRNSDFAGNVEKGLRFLTASCESGRFGSTQSTVLALRAIVAYDKARSHPLANGTVQLFVDGRHVGSPVPFDKNTQGAITLPDIGEVFEPGDHKIELRMSDGSKMPYSIAVNYNSLTPSSSKECQVSLSTALSNSNVEEGSVTEVNVNVTNLSKEGLPMTVAIVGVPGGLEPRHDQLKELVKAGRIAAYEVIGREVVLYWRDMKPSQEIELPISVVAAVPGSYTGPASRTYLYYTDEYKHWADGMKVEIQAK